MKNNTAAQKIRPLVRIIIVVIISTTIIVVTHSQHNLQAQSVNTWSNLGTVIGTSTTDNSPRTITIGNITVTNTSSGIIIPRPNITIKGTSTSTFGTNIDGIVADILARNNTITVSNITSILSATPISLSSPTLSSVSGNNGTRSLSLSTDYYSTAFKWFSTNYTDPSVGNGLSFQNILFKDVTIEYPSGTGTNGKYVNGLIGNSYRAGSTGAAQLISPGVYGTSLGKITGNEFSNIHILFKDNASDNDSVNYLAGGGIIGVRDTGEQAKGGTIGNTRLNVPLSAEMDIVSGNYFHNLTVTTTNSTYTTLQYGQSKSAYLEGGGIIGVNGVSSPSSSIGHALLKGLENNAFTDIKILSNDILLGGGIVGVNNNSKDTSGNAWDSQTYAKMEYVTGNIFGNGTADNITIKVGYSLRGGGVIGLNGLSSAQVELPLLNENVFAGISVTTGTYIKGGGIVGLQNNDGDAYKGSDGDGNSFSGTIEFTAAPVTARKLSNNVFINLDVSIGNSNSGSQYLQGGGIIGIRSNAGNAMLDQLTSNIFKDIKVDLKNATTSGEGLLGGGVVGVNSQTGFAHIKNASNNYFDNIAISVDGTITGSGVIGAANAGSADAQIDTVQNNTFTKTEVKTTGDGHLYGGGVIGISSVSGVNALSNVVGNRFYGRNSPTDLDIDIAGTIEGGGVIGARTSGTTGSSASFLSNASGNIIQNYNVKAAGTGTGTDAIKGGGLIGVSSNSISANIGNLANNQLINNKVTSAENITGGGLVGVLVGGTGGTSISAITGNYFKNNEVETTNSTYGKIEGGGIIGVNVGSTLGISTITSIANNTFDNTTVTSKSTLEGGGVIGVRTTAGYATLENLTNNTFKASTIDITGKLEGGGIIGVRADNNSADAFAAIGTIDRLFLDSTTKVTAGDIEGGGIIGVRANAGNAFIEKISAMRFSGDLMTDNVSAKSIEGGGVIGVRSESGKATIGSVANSNFSAINVKTTADHIQGGGIVSVRSDSLAKIDRISNTNFFWNNVTSKKWIDGGGIIGASGSAKGSVDPHGGIGLIEDVAMSGNVIKAEDGQIMGGLIYSYGAAGGMIIKDSVFGGNVFESKVTTNYTGYDDKVYGAITIDTGANKYGNDTEHVVTVTSTAKKQEDATVFYNNAIYDLTDYAVDNPPDRYNSFYFGTMPYIDTNNSNTATSDFAAADAKLIVASEATGIVLLLDPILASQQNGTSETYTFNMEVGRRNGSASGLLIWGGDNKFEILDSNGATDTGTAGSVTMFAGSTTTLVDKSSYTTLINYGEKWSQYDAISTMTLDAPNYTVDLQKGGWLNVEGHNYWNLSSDNSTDANLKVKFNGDLHFNLNNTRYYDDKTAPTAYTTDKTADKIPLLTIKTPDNKESVIDLAGATVHLQDFIDIYGKSLKSGDRFYLVDAIDGDADNTQKKFVNEDKLANNKDADGYFVAYARQGLTRGYYFIIDLNGEYVGTDADQFRGTHYLTARLRSAKPIPAKELVPPAEGRITGVSFLNHLATPNLYNIDPQCDPCDPCDSGSNWIKTPFVSIAGDWHSGDTSNNSHFHIRGSVFQAGLAFQKKVHNGRLFWGAFFDSGCADYDTYNYIEDIQRNPEFRGNGELHTTGGGLFAKRFWKNGWQFNGLVRGGNLRNEYYNPDINIHNTNFEMRYDTDSAYFSTELGLNKQWKIGKRRTFDLYGRYAYAYLESNTITWNYKTIDGSPLNFTEKVRFDNINSHRARLGTRYTQKRSSYLSWYLDGGYEYEFDGKAKGYAYDVGGFHGTKLRGGYGVGEIGLIYRRNDKFQLIAGLEGYTGKRTGGSLNFASTWKW